MKQSRIFRSSTKTAVLLVGLAMLVTASQPTLVFAYESCDEACPAQDEPGKISFLNGVNTEINCCCVEEIEAQPPVSHPLEDCEIPPP